MSKVTVVSRPNRITIASKGVQGAPGPQGEQGEQGPPGATDPELRSDLADPTLGAGLVAFQQTGTGAVSRDLKDKSREIVSPGDYTGVVTPILDVRHADDGVNWGVVLGLASQPAHSIGRGSVAIGGFTDSRVHRLPGSQELRCIVGGYDNEIADGPGTGGLACSILASHHSTISGDTTHATLVGGSSLTIEGGDYNGIFAGTSNKIEDDCNNAVILGGSQNTILSGLDVFTGGLRSAIIAGGQSTIRGRNSTILSGQSCNIVGNYSVLFGSSSTVSGTYNLVGGTGNSVDAQYALVLGSSMSCGANRSVVVGGGCVAGDGHAYSIAVGEKVVTPMPGVTVRSARQRGGVAGRNQSLAFTCSEESSAVATVRLRVLSGYPTMPEDSVVNGTFFLTAVDTTGATSAYEIACTIKRVGSGTPSVVHSAVTERVNELSLASPTINTTTGGVYRVQGTGLADKTIAWDAAFVGQQVVYTA